MNDSTTKTLAQYGTLALVQDLSSGECWIVDTKTGGQSAALGEKERAEVVADPGCMILADLVTEEEQPMNVYALRAAAMALVPARHIEGDVVWVETTGTLENDPAARKLSPEALAARVTASLDQAARAWKAEQEYQTGLEG